MVFLLAGSRRKNDLTSYARRISCRLAGNSHQLRRVGAQPRYLRQAHDGLMMCAQALGNKDVQPGDPMFDQFEVARSADADR